MAKYRPQQASLYTPRVSDSVTRGLERVGHFLDQGKHICNGRLLPWTTWDDVHSFFWIASTYLTAVIPREVLSGLYFSWSAVPISSVFVFVFFACGTEVMERRCASARSLGQAFVGSGTRYRSQPASVESEDKSQSTTKSAFSLISQTVGRHI
jgi:hypothetical protein